MLRRWSEFAAVTRGQDQCRGVADLEKATPAPRKKLILSHFLCLILLVVDAWIWMASWENLDGLLGSQQATELGCLGSSPSTHKLIHAYFWLQAMLNWDLCGEPCLDVYCFFLLCQGSGRIRCLDVFPFQGRSYGMATPSKGIDVSHLSLWLSHWRSLKDAGVPPPPPPGAAATRKAAPDDEEAKKKQRPAMETPTD